MYVLAINLIKMKPSLGVPLGALFLFCVVQLLALYLWLPHRIISNTSDKHSHADRRSEDSNRQSEDSNRQSEDSYLSPDVMKREYSPDSLGDLQAKFAHVAQTGRDRGLSDAEMMSLLLHALNPAAGSGNGVKSGTNFRQESRNKSLTNDVVRKVGNNLELQQMIVPSDGYPRLESYPWNNITDPVNPHDFKLVINQPDLCTTNGSDTFLLVLMISSPLGARQRQIQRDSCLSIKNISGRIIRSVFLLGNSGRDGVTAKVREEAAKYGDIIMEDFQESYRNLTLKTMMGIKWASVYCPKAQYVIKCDDDVYLSLTNIVNLLEKSPRERFVTGYVYQGTKPIRDKRYKWYISKETYPRDIYPPYCCGIGYIISQDLIPKIYTESLSIPYVFLEDVFVGLCIEKLNVVPKVNPGFFTYRQDYEYCKFKKAYVVHTKKIHEIGQFWIKQQIRPANVTC